MDKRAVQRQGRIEEIKAVIEGLKGKKFDRKEFIMQIAHKYVMTQRTAREYLQEAEYQARVDGTETG